jgi:hypothetical protein
MILCIKRHAERVLKSISNLKATRNKTSVSMSLFSNSTTAYSNTDIGDSDVVIISILASIILTATVGFIAWLLCRGGRRQGEEADYDSTWGHRRIRLPSTAFQSSRDVMNASTSISQISEESSVRIETSTTTEESGIEEEINAQSSNRSETSTETVDEGGVEQKNETDHAGIQFTEFKRT